RREDARRLRGRRQAAAGNPEDDRAAEPQVGGQGCVGRRIGGQAEERGRGAVMPTLLIAEHDNKALKDATHKAPPAAKGLGSEIRVLVAGQDCGPVAEAAAKLDGVAKVLLAQAPLYQHMLAEPIAALIVSLAGPYEAIVAPATTAGKNYLPRVAAL